MTSNFCKSKVNPYGHTPERCPDCPLCHPSDTVEEKIKPLKLPPLPRSVTGLKKDGKPDKRFTGATMANLQKWMEEASGTNDLLSTKRR